MKTTRAIESLESRIVPAAVFTFTDVDGDLAKIVTSKGTSVELAAVMVAQASGMGTAIREIDLSKNAGVFEGTNLLVSVTQKGENGDGRVNIGYIDAAATNGSMLGDGIGLALGTVVVQGDLGQIDVGKQFGRAINTLVVKSLGAVAGTQGANGSNGSEIFGSIGSLAVAGAMSGIGLDLSEAASLRFGSVVNSVVDVTGKVGVFKSNGTVSNTNLTFGEVGLVSVGDYVGGTSTLSATSVKTFLSAGDVTNKIFVNFLGTARIAGNLTGWIQATESSRIDVRGSLIGAGKSETGYISIAQNIGSISIAQDVLGTLAKETGFIEVGGSVKSVRVGGSVKSFSILTSDQSSTELDDSGVIRVGGDLGRLFIGGDLAGTGILTGVHSSDTTGAVIVQGALRSAVIGGSIKSGFDFTNTQQSSGTLQVGKSLGSLLVKGDVIGAFASAAYIGALGADAAPLAIGKIVIKGSVKDATIRAGDSGSEIDNSASGRDESIGLVQIGGGFVRSAILAGVEGQFNDPEVHSKIARIIIGGTATGGDMNTSYGFIAEEIGALKVAGKVIVLEKGKLNDSEIQLDPNGNTILVEKLL
jgi:hypothetical protein